MLFSSIILSHDVTQGLKEKYTEGINLHSPDVFKILVIILIAEQINSNSADHWFKKTALFGELVHT